MLKENFEEQHPGQVLGIKYFEAFKRLIGSRQNYWYNTNTKQILFAFSNE